MKVLFVYQYAFSKTGGIQSFNKLFIKALNQIDKEGEIEIDLLSIYDNSEDISTELNFKTASKNKFKAVLILLKSVLDYDIIILGHINLWMLAMLIKLIKRKTKIYFCTHGIEIWKRLPKSIQLAMNMSTILTVSEFSKRKLLQYNSKLKKIIVFPNAIEINKKVESNENKIKFDVKKLILLAVTRLDSTESLKGIDHTIKALSIIKRNNVDFQFNIIGKGADVLRLKKIAEKFQVIDQINFLGFVNDLEPYYNNCDIFIMPSKKEGFGIVYLEAMKYKKPIIAANYGGVTDVVENNVSGFLCEYGNVEEISDKITLLASDEQLRIAMGLKGYERLSNNFKYDHFLKNLKKVLL